MRAKAKSSSTPYPIWVEGEYITEPPIRPSDGAVRPAGHYIDKGGYPGANVYEVDINTMCRQTDAADRFGKPIYEQDILLYETAEEIGYFIVQDLETTVDMVLCQDLVQVKMSFSHSNLPAIPKLPVDTILQNHRVTYNRNDYEFVWYYKTFPSIQIPGGMHVCNC